MALVLLVDDDLNLLRALETLVTSDGYRVRTAVDGFDALSMVALEKPDLIVSDVMMPRMDGADLVRALKSEPAHAHIPVIMLSAAAFPHGLPIHALLSKPFPAARLLEVLREVQQP
ncbi:response regulator [Paraburkholderia sp. HD33-4]|uniref:response regulator n=1 Tax=Paraburkholderia sp. HD33-4 TaxID=2883242 RepID=UPI001F2114C6|nr:response regulator [Paraburkholderia sp. HD33-4]